MGPKEILARLAESGTPPDPASALRISVGLDESIRRFEMETLPFMAKGGSELQFAFAPYGRGKTHLLQSLQEVARRQGLATAYVDCRAGNAPFASLQNTYRSIAANLRPCSELSGGGRRSGPEAIIEEALLTSASDGAKGIQESLLHDNHLAIDFRNLVIAYSKVIGLSATQSQIGQDLRALLRADPSSRVRVGELYETEPWLPRPTGKLGRRNAAAWVRSMASLPTALGYKGLAILFDETEQSHGFGRYGARQRQVHLANLRNFVDHVAVGGLRGCVIYYAVVEEFLEMAKRELEALSQRIERVSLGGGSKFDNPRAVWVDIDELTSPSPQEDGFFDLLGMRIADLGYEAGLPRKFEAQIKARLRERGLQLTRSINVGAVREYVKFAADVVAQEVSRHG